MSGDDVYSFLEDIAAYPEKIIVKIKEGERYIYQQYIGDI